MKEKLTETKLRSIIREELENLNENTDFYVVVKRDNDISYWNKKEISEKDAWKLHDQIKKAQIPSVQNIEVVHKNELSIYKLKPIK